MEKEVFISNGSREEMKNFSQILEEKFGIKSRVDTYIGKYLLYVNENDYLEALSKGSLLAEEMGLNFSWLDKNNTLLDGSVKLIPDLYNLGGSAVAYSGYTDAYSAITSGWTVTHRSLKVSDMLPVISNDIESSVMVSDQISNQLVGYLGTDTRVESKINDALKYNGYFRFKNEKFTYLSSTNCYWLGDKYSDTKQFALVKADDLFSKIYGQDLLNESGTPNTCIVVPVIEVSKIKLRESSN